MAFKKSSASTTPAGRNGTTRLPSTLEHAVAICPTAHSAERIALSFGLESVDYDSVREAHFNALVAMAASLETTLNEKALAMHFQRLVGALGETPRKPATIFTLILAR